MVQSRYRLSYTNFGQLWELIKSDPNKANQLGYIFSSNAQPEAFIALNGIELVEDDRTNTPE